MRPSTIRKAAFAAALLSCALLASCVKPSDISVTGIEGVDVESLSQFTVSLRVANDSRYAVTITDVRFSIVDSRGEPVADFIVTDRIRLPRRTEQPVEIPLRMRIRNPIFLLGAIGDLPRSLDGCRIVGGGKARAGIASKKTDGISLPLSDIIRNFDAGEIEKILKTIGL